MAKTREAAYYDGLKEGTVEQPGEPQALNRTAINARRKAEKEGRLVRLAPDTVRQQEREEALKASRENAAKATTRAEKKVAGRTKAKATKAPARKTATKKKKLRYKG